MRRVGPPGFRPVVTWLERPHRTGRANTLALLTLIAVVAALAALS